jgi:hypothetical protein
MGHVRLGGHPKTRVWNEVVELLGSEPQDIPGIAAAVLQASEDDLRQRSTLAVAAHAFWVLLRLASASDRDGIGAELGALGVDAGPDVPLLRVLADLGDEVRAAPGAGREAGHFRDMAGLALRRSLLETVGEQGPALFGSTIEQLQEGFRRWSAAEQFGRLTRVFLGDFLARVLHAAVDRELSNHVGRDGSFGDAGESRAFDDALDRYGRESAAIAERFATEWYAKRRWQEKATFTERDAVRFTAVALRKLQSDLTFARETR